MLVSNAAVLNHSFSVPGPVIDWPAIRFGRSVLKPVATSDGSPENVGVAQPPLANVNVPEILNPSRIFDRSYCP